MKEIHSFLAYIVLVLMLMVIYKSFFGYKKERDFTKKDKLFGLFAMIFVHTQMTIGLIWYFQSPYFQAMISGEIKAIMSDSDARLLAVEHPITMLISVVLITIGWSKHKKKETSKDKFKMFSIFYSLGFLLILLMLPWKQWLA